MSETKILEHVALMTRLNEQGVRAETTKQARKALADQYGVRIPVNQTPLNERESWTLNSAAKVWNIDYHRGRLAADPEYRTTGNGIPVVNLRILSSGWEKDTAGNPVDVTPTSWQCEAWRELAEHIVTSLRKGDQVLATVRPQTNRFEKRDGGTGWSTRWVIEDIGPSLQRATTAITRIQRDRHAQPQPPQDGYYEPPSTANDPWTNQGAS